MPGVNECYVYSLRDCYFLIIVMRNKQRQSLFDIGHGVKRNILLAAGPFCLAVSPLRLRFLNVRGIAEHNAREFRGRACQMNRAAKAL